MNNRQFYNAVQTALRLNYTSGVKVELSKSAEDLVFEISHALEAERAHKENMQALNRARYLIGDEGGVIQAEMKAQTEALRKVRAFLREEVV